MAVVINPILILLPQLNGIVMMMMRSGLDDAPEFIDGSSEGKDAYPSSLVHFPVVDFDAIVRIGS